MNRQRKPRRMPPQPGPESLGQRRPKAVEPYTNAYQIRTYTDTYRRIVEDMLHAVPAAAVGDSIAADYIARMIPCHLAAVRMADNLLRFTEDAGLRNLAASTAARENTAMKALRCLEQHCRQQKNTPEAVAAYRQQAERLRRTAAYTLQHLPAFADSPDALYRRQMAALYRGTVGLSALAVRQPIDARLRAAAEITLTEQRQTLFRLEQQPAAPRCRKGR